MRLIRAITELLEAKAENIREDTATMQLGKYAAGYKDGQEDATCCCESAYVGTDEDDDL